MTGVRKGTESPARRRVRAAFEAHGTLTQKQLRAVLGNTDKPETLDYHVRRLVQAGALIVTRDAWKVRDGSQLRYTLARKRVR